MASERSIRRYRRWYARLLRLYPRPFRQRFSEPMTQTFADLARERDSTRPGSLPGFVVATFAETATAIVRENVRHMLVQTNAIVRWVLITAIVLAIPAIAMALALGDVQWGPMDFAVAGVIVLGFGLLYEYASRRSGSVLHRAAIGIAALASLGLVWVNLAVGMMDVESGNLLYVLVLFVAVAGVAIGRFEPRHAAIAMFATAATHAAVAIIGQVAGLGPTLPADAFWVVGWVASALLFRQAALRSSPAT